MGLIAYNKLTGESIISVDLDTNDWENLKHDKIKKGFIIMGCCNQKAILKTSKLGLQYFAHIPGTTCNYQSESMQHLYLKSIAYKLAKDMGINANLEHRLKYQNTFVIPDLLLDINGSQIAIEFQVTCQSNKCFIARTNKYKEIGIPVIWFYKDLKESKFTLDKELQIYPIEIIKKTHISIKYNKTDFAEFFREKIISSKQLFDIDIRKYIKIEEDGFVRLPQNQTIDNMFILFKKTWVGYANGFYFNAEENKNIVLKGFYILGFFSKEFHFIFEEFGN